jgi:hypothetical protein
LTIKSSQEYNVKPLEPDATTKLKQPEVDATKLKQPEPDAINLMQPEPDANKLKQPEPDANKLKQPEVDVNKLKQPELDINQLLRYRLRPGPVIAEAAASAFREDERGSSPTSEVATGSPSKPTEANPGDEIDSETKYRKSGKSPGGCPCL